MLNRNEIEAIKAPLAAALKNQLDAIEAGMEILLTLELAEIEARLQRRLDVRWREIERQGALKARCRPKSGSGRATAPSRGTRRPGPIDYLRR